MKTKKIGFIAVATAVLLITAVLVTTCMEPVGQGDFVFDFTPAEGMGYLVLKSNNPRTLFPNTLGISDLGDFDAIDIIIYNHGTTTSAIPAIEDIDPADFTGTGVYDNPIQLPPGFYDVVVLGKKVTPLSPETTPGNFEPIVVAFGMDDDGGSGVEIVAGTGGAATVTLKEIIDGEGNGLFSYNFSLPTVTTAVMAFTPLSGQPPQANITLVDVNATPAPINAPSGNVELASGFWRVITTLTLTGSQTIAYRETVHIYEGFETVYGTSTTPIQFAPLNNMTYAITFYDYDGTTHAISTATELTGITRLHGTNLDPSDFTATTPPGPSLYTFDGWFTTATLATQWTTAPVYRPMNLYAGWSLATVANLVVTVTVDITDPSATDIVLVEDLNDISTGILVINITNYTNFTTIEWYHNNTDPTFASPLLSDGDKFTITASSLTIDFNEFTIADLINGTQVFTAVGDPGINERTNFVTVTFSLP